MLVPSALLAEESIVAIMMLVINVVIGMNYNGRYVMTCIISYLLRKREDALRS